MSGRYPWMILAGLLGFLWLDALRRSRHYKTGWANTLMRDQQELSRVRYVLPRLEYLYRYQEKVFSMLNDLPDGHEYDMLVNKIRGLLDAFGRMRDE